jgi:MacB-like periplasmic core domain
MEGESRRRVTLSNVLVVGQLSLSLVLLVAGALLARGLVTAKATDLGYDPRQVSLLSFNLQMNGYDVGRATAFRERALSALRGLPGVTAVSTASRLPLSPDINMDSILVQGHHVPGDDGTLVDAAAVGADYFRVVGVLIVAGRAFTEDDVRQKRKVAVVNETLARQYWPDGSAVGRQIYTGTFASVPFEIVGVARDHKVRSVGEDPRPYLHVPESPDQQIGLIARTVTPAAAALPMFREALWALEPHILFTEDTTAEHVAATTVALGALAAAGVARVLDSLLYGGAGSTPPRMVRPLECCCSSPWGRISCPRCRRRASIRSGRYGTSEPAPSRPAHAMSPRNRFKCSGTARRGSSAASYSRVTNPR